MLTPEEIKQIGLEMCRVIEDNVNPQFDTIRTDIQEIRTDIQEIRGTMVTKEDLNKKLAQGMQLRSLVDLLEAKQVISADEAKRLFIMTPLPQTL